MEPAKICREILKVLEMAKFDNLSSTDILGINQKMQAFGKLISEMEKQPKEKKEADGESN